MLKRFLITSLLFLFPIFFVGAAIYYQELNNAKNILEIQAIESLKGQNEQILDEFGYIVSDLMFLAQQQELQKLLDNDTNTQRQILADEYCLFASTKNIYDQVRFLDETGLEIARANSNAGTPASKLQQKGKRYYFQDTFVLNQNEVFVSPFDLNIEQGQIEHPLKPMIRFGTPVFDSTGQKRGIVLLNYFGAKLLKKMAERAATASSAGGRKFPGHSKRSFGACIPKRELGNEKTYLFSFPSSCLGMHSSKLCFECRWPGNFRHPALVKLCF